MTDSKVYERWRRARGRGEVPAGFTDRVMDGVGQPLRASRGSPAVVWGSRAALILLALGALAFRVGSVLAVVAVD